MSILNRNKQLRERISNLESIIANSDKLFSRLREMLWDVTVEGIRLGDIGSYYTSFSALHYWMDRISLAKQAREEKERIIAIVQEELTKQVIANTVGEQREQSA